MDKEIHAKPKFISSYGGWNRSGGIPLHAWKLNTIKQIGETCGGFIEVARETIEKSELIEGLIKIKDNYTGFIPANIRITDEKGDEFIVHSVTHTDGRWLRERNPKIHGSFTKRAAEKFNKFKFDAEQYFFKGNIAMLDDSSSPEPTPKREENTTSHRKTRPTFINKIFKPSHKNLNLNCDGDSNNINKSRGEKIDMTLALSEKKKGKKICVDDTPSKPTPINTKRKVSFYSPKNETFFYCPQNVPTKSLKIGIPKNSPQITGK